MNKVHHHITIGLLLLAGMLVGADLSAQQAWGELTVIGNKTGQTQLKTSEARNIFRAKTTTWPNKVSVTIALPSPQANAAEPVARLIYGTKPASVQKFWLLQVFQGRATPPSFFDTDQELIQFVQKTPGAIGVIAGSTPVPPTLTIISIQN
jgi:ABC-type phosphate transport system substrate-binding protein